MKQNIIQSPNGRATKSKMQCLNETCRIPKSALNIAARTQRKNLALNMISLMLAGKHRTVFIQSIYETTARSVFHIYIYDESELLIVLHSAILYAASAAKWMWMILARLLPWWTRFKRRFCMSIVERKQQTQFSIYKLYIYIFIYILSISAWSVKMCGGVLAVRVHL